MNPNNPISSKKRIIPLSAEEREFHLEEYKQLKAEIGFIVDHAWKVFYYSIVLSAGFIGWVVTHRNSTLDGASKTLITQEIWNVLIFVPFFAVIAAALLSFALYVRVLEVGSYLRKCHPYLGHSDLNWEMHIPRVLRFKRSFGAENVMAAGLSRTAAVMAVCWLVLLALNLLFAFMVHGK